MEEIDAWAPGAPRTREMRQRRVLWSWLLFRRRMLESSRELKPCRLDRDIPQVWPGEQRYLLISHIGPAMAMWMMAGTGHARLPMMARIQHPSSWRANLRNPPGGSPKELPQKKV